MMKQGKLRFLSARILCVIIGLIVVIGILSLLLLFDSFKESSVNVVILAFCIGLTLLLCCFFWKMIVKPFNQMEKNLGLFLDGYTTSHLMGEDNIFYISPAYEGVITKIPFDIPILLKCFQVGMDGRGGFQIHSFTDLPNSRRITSL